MEDKSVQMQNDPTVQTSQTSVFPWIIISILCLIIGFGLGMNYTRMGIVKEDAIEILPTPTPTLTPTPTITLLVTGKNPTPTQSTTKLQSNLCPVAFIVPYGKIYVPSTGATMLWQLKDFPSDRFGFLPRAEETNGRRVDVQLRGENQLYGNGAGSVSVYCQDNPNRWNQTDFLSYVLKTPDIMDPYMTQVTLWGRQVGKLTYKGYDGNTHTEWFFTEKGLLFHASPVVYDETTRAQIETVFNQLVFFP